MKNEIKKGDLVVWRIAPEVMGMVLQTFDYDTNDEGDFWPEAKVLWEDNLVDNVYIPDLDLAPGYENGQQ